MRPGPRAGRRPCTNASFSPPASCAYDMDERRTLIPEKRIDESLGRVRADVAAARQNDSIISTTSPSLEANRPSAPPGGPVSSQTPCDWAACLMSRAARARKCGLARRTSPRFREWERFFSPKIACEEGFISNQPPNRTRFLPETTRARTQPSPTAPRVVLLAKSTAQAPAPRRPPRRRKLRSRSAGPSCQSPVPASSARLEPDSPIGELADVQNGMTVFPEKSLPLAKPSVGQAAMPHQMG